MENIKKKFLQLQNYFNEKVIYEEKDCMSNRDLGVDGIAFNMLQFDENGLMRNKNNYFKVNLSKDKNDVILCRKQSVLIDCNVKAVKFLGFSIWGSFRDDITILYEDLTTQKNSLDLHDVGTKYNSENMFESDRKYDIQRKNLFGQYNCRGRDLFLYYNVFETDRNKKISHIMLPNNELMFILAITLEY